MVRLSLKGCLYLALFRASAVVRCLLGLWITCVRLSIERIKVNVPWVTLLIPCKVLLGIIAYAETMTIHALMPFRVNWS